MGRGGRPAFPAATPLPHQGLEKGSGEQPARKTIGYSYPVRGAEDRSAPLSLRSQVSPAAACLGTWGTQLFRKKCSGDPPQKAPMEGDGDPTARAPLPTLQVQATGDQCPFSPSQNPPPTSVSQAQPPLASLAAAAHPPAGHRVPSTEDLKRPRGHGQSLAGTRDTDVPSAACPERVHLANRGFRG